MKTRERIEVAIPQEPSLPTVEPSPIRYAAAKRTFDVVGATFFLLLAFPFFVIVALLVRLTSPGPIFYKSVRIGLGGRPFTFIKFRSMFVDADQRLAELRKQNEKDGPIFKIEKDPRVTPVGRVLRKFSLDELPQFLHVLSGEMSLVGPRPPLAREVVEYDEGCLVRLSVKPGITCFWQIMGRSRLSFAEWMALDQKYVREMSFWTDLKILVRTPVAVLRGFGAY
ncbi:MAG TPA: sugar transferase [Fimbriimonas sp.]|nr:sugar transferase [Fimbriimonas sp.]